MFARPKPSVAMPAPLRSQAFSRLPSIGGVNALDPLMGMPEQDCIYTFNLMPVEIGMRLRKGYLEWSKGTGIGDIRTVVPYESPNPGEDRLWAVTENGIYDASTQNNATMELNQVQSFSVQNDSAGFGVSAEWVADNLDRYLFYADEANGIWQYTEDPDTWARPTGWTYDPDNNSAGTPVPFDRVVFITVFKQRLWFILRDDIKAYYSEPAAISGDFTGFTFGAKMPRGGDLRGLYDWSLDGGDGIDDYMVAIGRGGDLLIYQGFNPGDATTWDLRGAWYIGEVPNTRKLTTEYGSEVYVLSVFGLTNLNDLLRGVAVNQLRESPSAKVNRYLRADVEQYKSNYGWAIENNPSDGFLQVVTPKPSSGEFLQYNQNLNTKAWGFWDNVPVVSASAWQGDYFIGGEDGTVWLYDGEYDGRTIAGDPGEPIYFRTLSSFQALEAHSTNTLVGFLRAIGLTVGSVNINIQPIYDYAVDAQIVSPGPATDSGVSLWDVAKWDQDVWVGGPTSANLPVSTLGGGRVAAIALSGNASDRVQLLGWDGTYEKGGPM